MRFVLPTLNLLLLSSQVWCVPVASGARYVGTETADTRGNGSANARRENDVCVQPFTAYPTEELLVALSRNLADTEMELIVLTLLFVDENGTLFEPGSCPADNPPFPALDAGLPLLWFIARGVFGSAFTKLPHTQVDLYTLGDPLKKYVWFGELLVNASDSCWRYLHASERAARLASTVAPLLQNSSALVKVAEPSPICYRVPSRSHRELSVVSIQAQLDNQQYICCRPVVACDTNQTNCPQICDQPKDPDMIVEASLYLFATLVLYVALFLLPLPALWMQNQLSISMREKKELQNKSEQGIGKEPVDMKLTSGEMPIAIQANDRTWTLILAFTLLFIFFAWVGVDIFYLVPARTSSYNSFDRSCDIGFLPVMVFTLAMSVLVALFSATVYNWFWGTNLTAQPGKMLIQLTSNYKAFQTLALPLLFPVFTVCSFCLCRRTVKAWKNRWMCDVCQKRGITQENQDKNTCDHCKRLRRHYGWLDVAALIFFSPIAFLIIFTDLVTFVPAVRFLARGWDRTAQLLHPEEFRTTNIWERYAAADNEMTLRKFVLYNTAYLFAFASSFCLLWTSWIAVFDAMSFVMFTFLSHFVTNPSVTLYVLAAVLGVVIEVYRQVSRLDHTLNTLYDTVAELDEMLTSDLSGDEGDAKVMSSAAQNNTGNEGAILSGCGNRQDDPCRANIEERLDECVSKYCHKKKVQMDEDILQGKENQDNVITWIEKIAVCEEFLLRFDHGFFMEADEKEAVDNVKEQVRSVQNLFAILELSPTSMRATGNGSCDRTGNTSDDVVFSNPVADHDWNALGSNGSSNVPNENISTTDSTNQSATGTNGQPPIGTNESPSSINHSPTGTNQPVPMDDHIARRLKPILQHLLFVAWIVFVAVDHNSNSEHPQTCNGTEQHQPARRNHKPAFGKMRDQVVAYQRLTKWMRFELRLRLLFFLFLAATTSALFVIYAIVLTQNVFESLSTAQNVLVVVVAGGIPQLSRLLSGPKDDSEKSQDDRIKIKKRLIENLKESIDMNQRKAGELSSSCTMPRPETTENTNQPPEQSDLQVMFTASL